LDISVAADTGPIAVTVQGACGVRSTEQGCFTAEPSEERHYRSLEAGTWYVIFKTPLPDSFSFDISFGVAEPGIPLNFIALPWDFYQWDEPAASVLYRAVTYGYGGEPVVGAVQQCADTVGTTDFGTPGGPYAGEYHATIGALLHEGMDPGSIVEIVDARDAADSLGTYDVLLFSEFELCWGTGPAMAAEWLPTIEAHLAGGGRVVTMNGGDSNMSFISNLGLFGSCMPDPRTGTCIAGAASPPFTLEDHDFWDGSTTMTSMWLNATVSWSWSGDYLVPLARATGSGLMVWGYEVP
jgi:hypothetical protein